MESSLDYIVQEEEIVSKENDYDERNDEDNLSIQNFIQNGPCKLEDIDDDIESVEICEQIVNRGIKVTMEDFKILTVIGRGGYGKVFLAQKCSPGHDQNKLYAMKVLKKARIIRNEKDTAHTKSERTILEMIKHPFLVKLHYAFQNQSNLYIVLTYCSGGELFTYLEREGTLMENQACFYISEISLAIGHLHGLGIIYRDLKPENVLLDKRGHVKLTDFGLSKESVSLTNTFCGTIEYMAPEILKRGGHGKEVDWWSLGTLLFDMLSGGPPFSQEFDKQETISKILHATISFPKYFSTEVIRLISGLLKRNPKDRLGCKNDVEDIKNHEFFKVHDVDWDDVYNRRMDPPFKPELKSETDVSCFDSTFTGQQPIMTPDDFNGSHVSSDLFQGFSYVAPNVASGIINEPMTGLSRHSRRRNLSGLSENSFNPLNVLHRTFINENDFIDMSCNDETLIDNQSTEDSPSIQFLSHNSDNAQFFNSHSNLSQSRHHPAASSNLIFLEQFCNPVEHFLRQQQHHNYYHHYYHQPQQQHQPQHHPVAASSNSSSSSTTTTTTTSTSTAVSAMNHHHHQHNQSQSSPSKINNNTHTVSSTSTPISIPQNEVRKIP